MSFNVTRISNGWIVSWIGEKQASTLESMMKGEVLPPPKAWYFATRKAMTEGMPALMEEVLKCQAE